MIDRPHRQTCLEAASCPLHPPLSPHTHTTGCVGPQSAEAGKASACAGCPNQKLCASGEARAPDPAVALVGDKLAGVKHKVVVLSGKGGVGKTTFSCQLAFALAARGLQVRACVCCVWLRVGCGWELYVRGSTSASLRSPE